MHKEINWSHLPSDTPPIIQFLVRKCLTRDRKRRLRDIGDAVVDLEHAIADPSSSFIRLSEGAPQETNTQRGMPLTMLVGLVLAVALIAVALGWFLKPTSVPGLAPIRQIEINLGTDMSLATNHGGSIRLSPDGSTLAYLVRSQESQDGGPLYIRRLDRLEATPLNSAEDISDFSFSPGGQSIVFYRDGALHVAPVGGGAARKLCDLNGSMGIDWREDEFILIGSYFDSLYRVSSKSGLKEPISTLREGDGAHVCPQLLPGARAVLYTALNLSFDDADIVIQPLPDGEPEVLWKGGAQARYLPSGHLVFIDQGTLFAATLDLDALKLIGQPAPVIPEVLSRDFDAGYMPGHFDVSKDGTLVYVKGSVSIQVGGAFAV